MFFGQDNYDYTKLENDLSQLKRFFDIDLDTIGKSVCGRNLYAVTIGSGPKHVFYNGVHHGLEWITAPLLVRFLYDVLNYSMNHTRLVTYNVEKMLERVTLHVVPMVNPDGVDIVLHGVDRESQDYAKLVSWNRSEDFSKRWQSNYHGVDLNHNYDAGFELSKKAEYEYGILGPSYTRYVGEFPESEPETKAVCDYVRKNDFSLVLAYHSQGEVIYYDYNGYVPEHGYEIGKQLSLSSGYLLDKTAGIASYGGFKDWFIQTYQRPGYTIEVGHGVNPLGIYQFEEIYQKNVELMILAAYLC